MKKYAKFFLCLILVFAMNTVMVYAAEPDNGKADDGIFEALNDVKAKGSYLEYRDNYYLDMEDTSILSSPGAVIFNMLANGIFGWSKNIGCLTAVATKFALGVDIYNLISDFISPFFKSMQKIVFDSYATYFIAAAAFYFLIQLLRSRHSQVIGGLIAVTMIIAVGLFFYARPMFVLSTLNNITTELSSTVMDAPYDTLTNEEADDATAEDKSVVLIFNVMVHSQWQYLEFGSLKQAQKHEASILPLEVDSDERTDYISELDKQGLTKGNTAAQIERFGLALIFFLFNILMLVIVLGFSVLILGYQFFVLFLAVLGTFIFILALIPGYGPKLLKRWALKLLTTSAAKIILVFFLSIIFIIMSFLYTATAKYGLLPVLFMMLSMCLIVALKRKDIIELFLGTSGGKVIGAAGNIAEGTYSELSFLRQKVNNLRQKSPQEEFLTEEELRQYRMRMDEEQRRKAEAAQRDGTGATQTDGHSIGRFSGHNKKTAKGANEKQNNINRQEGKTLQEEQLTNEDFKNAEEILEKNYRLSQKKSEQTAKESGESVQYSDFVQRTNAVRELGGNARFDDRDILKTAHILQRTKAAGGSIEDLIGDPQERNSGETQHGKERPKSVTEYMTQENREGVQKNNGDADHSAEEPIRNTHDEVSDEANTKPLSAEKSEPAKEQSQTREVVLNSAQEANPETSIREKKGLNFFKERFGEDKGEKYYEKMCSKYGEENVSRFSSEKKVSYSEVNQILRSSMGEKNDS